MSRRRRRAHLPAAAALPSAAPTGDGTASPVLLDSPSQRRLFAACVFAMTFVAFLPALNGEFLLWDDDKNFLNNQRYRGLGAKHLSWMWSLKNTKMGHYHPLTWMTLGLDYVVADAWYRGRPDLPEGIAVEPGMHPGPYHFSNILLHALTAVAFFFLARRLLALVGPSPPRVHPWIGPCGAAFAALFFGVHPLRVESVAWVTERRDVLSGVFFVLCLYAYVRYRSRDGSTWWYVAGVVLAVLSLLSKAWGMVLPVILLVLDAYPFRRLAWAPWRWFKRSSWRVLAEKLPFLFLAVATAIMAHRAQASQGENMKSLAVYGIDDRIAQAFYGLAFYTRKTLLPTELIPIHEIPVDMDPLAPGFLFSAAAVIVAVVLLIRFARRFPAGPALAVCYGAILAPVLGIAQSGPQLVADRYSYLACLTWALVAGAALIRLGVYFSRPRAVAAVAGMVVAVLAAATWKQSTYWRNSYALWERTLAVDPDCWNANNNLGILLKQDGKVPEAIIHYQRSLEINPDNADALFNLGNAFKAQKRFTEAVDHYRRAIKLKPNHRSAHLNLGNTLKGLGRTAEAIDEWKIAARLEPKSQTFHAIAYELNNLGRSDEAIAYYHRALKINAQRPLTLVNLGDIYRARGDDERALAYYERALQINPRMRQAQRGRALLRAQPEPAAQP